MKGDSFERRTRAAAEYASAHGLELDTKLTFRDLGVSAFRGRNAQTGALKAFLEGVEQGDIPQGSYLLVESLDRVSRDQIIAAQSLFLGIIDAGVTLVTLTDNKAFPKEVRMPLTTHHPHLQRLGLPSPAGGRCTASGLLGSIVCAENTH
jgi:DNA invertase Pin-like site-specific DNA recombinase